MLRFVRRADLNEIVDPSPNNEAERIVEPWHQFQLEGAADEITENHLLQSGAVPALSREDGVGSVDRQDTLVV